jgi:hypothetical protein
MTDTAQSANEATGSDEAVPAGEPRGVSDQIDRRAIRKSRAKAGKQAKRFVKDRYKEIMEARPPGSRPADQVLRTAVALYDNGPLHPRDLKDAIARLEVQLRRQLPDLWILRAPKSASRTPQQVGLMVFEPRAVSQGTDEIISAENHSVVLTPQGIVFISGLLPGGTRPHLFQRIVERGTRHRTFAEVQMELSTIWPTLLWMRTEQRLGGRGVPLSVMLTPFANGLLFGTLVKVVDLPPAGPTVSIVTTNEPQNRTLHDFYGDAEGNRIWAMTNTFVDEHLLASDQIEVRDALKAFLAEYEDVVADNNWRWRIGLGCNDVAVAITARTFKLTVPSEARRASALAALEGIVTSPSWQAVSARSLASQQARARRNASQP